MCSVDENNMKVWSNIVKICMQASQNVYKNKQNVFDSLLSWDILQELKRTTYIQTKRNELEWKTNNAAH